MQEAPAAPVPRDIDRLLDAAGISIERLPMLRIAIDRMATLCSDSFRPMSASPAFFSPTKIATGRIGDILESYAGNVVAAVYHATEWDSRIVLGLDRKFLFAAVETVFGGDGEEPQFEDERPFSTLELRVAQAIFEQAVNALKASFASVADTPFKFERIETRMDFVNIGRPKNLAVVAKIGLKALGRGGEMFVVIPQTALNPMRQSLARDLSSDVSARDPRWSKQFENEIRRTEVTLKAMIEERQFTLGDIAALEVGHVLKLQATPKSRVKLECNDEALFWCQLGQGEGSYTVRIEDFVDQEQEFLDDLLPR
ncbi:MAG: flagellar motor switch protein FliM [Hyphomicrobiales bacterium]